MLFYEFEQITSGPVKYDELYTFGKSDKSNVKCLIQFNYYKFLNTVIVVAMIFVSNYIFK
jgi:hypothetical protein